MPIKNMIIKKFQRHAFSEIDMFTQTGTFALVCTLIHVNIYIVNIKKNCKKNNCKNNCKFITFSILFLLINLFICVLIRSLLNCFFRSSEK